MTGATGEALSDGYSVCNLNPFPPLPSGSLFRDAVTACLLESPVDGNCDNPDSQGGKYGPISEWDTSQTTDMTDAFNGNKFGSPQQSFNGVASSIFGYDS